MINNCSNQHKTNENHSYYMHNTKHAKACVLTSLQFTHTAGTCSNKQIQTREEKTTGWANGKYQYEDTHQLTLHETPNKWCQNNQERHKQLHPRELGQCVVRQVHAYACWGVQIMCQTNKLIKTIIIAEHKVCTTCPIKHWNQSYHVHTTTYAKVCSPK